MSFDQLALHANTIIQASRADEEAAQAEYNQMLDKTDSELLQVFPPLFCGIALTYQCYYRISVWREIKFRTLSWHWQRCAR